MICRMFGARSAALIGVIASLVVALTVFAPSRAVAQTVVSETHYQKYFTLQCSGIICQVTLPAVAAKRRLILEHITCQIVGGPNGALIPGNFEIKNGNGVLLFRKLITPVFRNSDSSFNIGYYAYDQKTEMHIMPNQTAVLQVAHTSGGITSSGCDLTGRLQVLQ